MTGYGDKIKYYRLEKKLTQEGLGSRLDPPVTKSFISKLESENTKPSLEMLLKIAEILEVEVGDLLDNKVEATGELKEAGADWVKLGAELEEVGISPEQVKQWAEIVKTYSENN